MFMLETGSHCIGDKVYEVCDSFEEMGVCVVLCC